VILAEADVLSKTGSSLGYTGLATLDYEPTQGLHLALTGQLLDRGKPELGAGPGRGEALYDTWLTADWFFAPHFELRTDLVVRGSDRGQLIQVQLHMYL
jgi:hypothetical protein